ncbi:MAG: photosystem II reaction center protein J [Cyanobacteria bacterium P01_H01_bin.15]
MFANGKIPIWMVGTIAGMGVLALVAIFFYGAYSGVGSSL